MYKILSMFGLLVSLFACGQTALKMREPFHEAIGYSNDTGRSCSVMREIKTKRFELHGDTMDCIKMLWYRLEQVQNDLFETQRMVYMANEALNNKPGARDKYWRYLQKVNAAESKRLDSLRRTQIGHAPIK